MANDKGLSIAYDIVLTGMEGGISLSTRVVWSNEKMDIVEYIHKVLVSSRDPLLLNTPIGEVVLIPNDVLQKSGIVVKRIDISKVM